MAALPEDEFVRQGELVFENHRSLTGICSFGGDPRSILMWSHYAASSTGACLHFEVARDPGAFLDALRVKYDREYPQLDWLADPVTALEQALLRKAPCWQYESESRIIRLNAARTHLHFHPVALTGVILGHRASETTRSTVADCLEYRRSLQMPTPIVYEARMHASRDELTISRSAAPSVAANSRITR